MPHTGFISRRRKQQEDYYDRKNKGICMSKGCLNKPKENCLHCHACLRAQKYYSGYKYYKKQCFKLRAKLKRCQ